MPFYKHTEDLATEEMFFHPTFSDNDGNFVATGCDLSFLNQLVHKFVEAGRYTLFFLIAFCLLKSFLFSRLAYELQLYLLVCFNKDAAACFNLREVSFETKYFSHLKVLFCF